MTLTSKLQRTILEAMGEGEKLTGSEISRRVNQRNQSTRILPDRRPYISIRTVLNSLCWLRGRGYVTDGHRASRVENGSVTWSTPPEYNFHVSGKNTRWMKLPSRYAASPPEIQEKFADEQ